MEDNKMVKIISSPGGGLTFCFKLENGENLICDYDECKKVMKKIDKGEIKIVSWEENNEKFSDA